MPVLDDERNETALERWDRNFAELLQELRVAQTGVQILLAFLFSLPFLARFAQITTLIRIVYVITLIAAATAAALLIAPVSHHRRLFRQGRKPQLVRVTSVLAQVGLAALLLAISGAVFLVLNIVVGLGWAVALSAGVVAVFVGLWYLLPLVAHRETT